MPRTAMRAAGRLLRPLALSMRETTSIGTSTRFSRRRNLQLRRLHQARLPREAGLALPFKHRTYGGNVVLTKASGSGAVSGTLTKAAVSGVATFNDVQFSSVDTYTLHADSDSFSPLTSGNISVADATAPTDFFRSAANGAWNV